MSVAWHQPHQPHMAVQPSMPMPQPQSYMVQQHYMTQQQCMTPMMVQRPVVVQQQMMVQQPVMVRRMVQQPFTVQHNVQRVVPVHRHVRYWLPSQRPDYDHRDADYRNADYRDADYRVRRRSTLRRRQPLLPKPAMGASTAVRVAGGYKVYNTEGGEADADLHTGRFDREEGGYSTYRGGQRGGVHRDMSYGGEPHREAYRDKPLRTSRMHASYDDEHCMPSERGRALRRSSLPEGRAISRDFHSRSASYAGTRSFGSGRFGGSHSAGGLLDESKLGRMSTESLAGLISDAARSLARRP